MNTFRRIAVLDIGKTNAKVVVVDCHSGEEVAQRRISNDVVKGPPYCHYDTDALWSFICGCLAEFAGVPGYDGISVTTHGAAAALIDSNGNLCLPVIDYEECYPFEISQTYDRLRPAFHETFSPRLAGGLNLGAQIHYQKTAFADAFSRVKTIITYPQYWAFRLSGVAANEVTSLGCHTDLWLPREKRYSSLVDNLEIGSLMAPVRSAFDMLGETTSEISEVCRLSHPVPVFCGIHDSNASLLPHLRTHTLPFAVVSTGTWMINFAVGGNLEQLDPRRDCLANVDANGRAVASSRFMGGREFECLTKELGPFNPQAAQATIPNVIDRSMMMLPNLAMGSGPYPGVTRRWINDGSATNIDRWAAACLYFSLMTDTCLELINAQGPVLIEGPFSHNPAFLTVLRDLVGRDVLAMRGVTGTAQGAALLAGISSVPQEHVPVTRKHISGLTDYRRAWRNLAWNMSS